MEAAGAYKKPTKRSVMDKTEQKLHEVSRADEKSSLAKLRFSSSFAHAYAEDFVSTSGIARIFPSARLACL